MIFVVALIILIDIFATSVPTAEAKAYPKTRGPCYNFSADSLLYMQIAYSELNCFKNPTRPECVEAIKKMTDASANLQTCKAANPPDPPRPSYIDAKKRSPVLPKQTLSKEEKQAMLDEHNLLRSYLASGSQRFHPSAANLVLMEWDDRLGETSSAWSNDCANNYLTHSKNEFRAFAPFAWAGQSGYFTSSIEDIAKAVDQWYEEGVYYSFENDTCNPIKTRTTFHTCGHYTQTVWHNTYLMGCGRGNCPSSKYTSPVFCDYAPCGNAPFTRPYTPGKPCSKCPSSHSKCHKSLCTKPETCTKYNLECSDAEVNKQATVPITNAVNAEDIIPRVL